MYEAFPLVADVVIARLVPRVVAAGHRRASRRETTGFEIGSENGTGPRTSRGTTNPEPGERSLPMRTALNVGTSRR